MVMTDSCFSLPSRSQYLFASEVWTRSPAECIILCDVQCTQGAVIHVSTFFVFHSQIFDVEGKEVSKGPRCDMMRKTLRQVHEELTQVLQAWVSFALK